MSDVNVILLSGRLAFDPEVKETSSGPITKLRLCSSRGYQSKDGQEKKRTVYINVVTFGKAAESHANWLAKGDEILAEGLLGQSEWTDKQGQKRSDHSIEFAKIQYLRVAKWGRGREEGSEAEHAPASPRQRRREPDPTFGPDEIDEEGLPL